MKKRLVRILAASGLFAAGLLLPDDRWISIAAFVLAWLIVGADVVLEAIGNIFRGNIFDENFLMALATVGAFAIGEYPEAAAVMLFYQVGELFQSYAVDKSRRSIASLMNIRPDYANRRRGEQIEKVDPAEVALGELILVRPGEKIPLDGVVVEGRSALDTAALTGESLPRDVEVGDTVLSGCVNISGVLTVRVEKEFGESTVSKILDLVENAGSKKSSSEAFISRFAAVYTPAVVVAAALLAVLPPLLLPGQTWGDWIYRALTFLVVSCPCALVISIPLSFFGGLGGASRNGVLIKGGNYLEALAKVEIAVFDKTGTLTQGVFEVGGLYPVGMEPQELLHWAACAENFSSHPISESLRRACSEPVDAGQISDAEEIAGQGVRADVGGRLVLAGNLRLMEENGISAFQGEIRGTAVHVAVDGVYAGYIEIADRVKPDAADAIRRLKAAGVRKTVILTGDNRKTGEAVAAQLGIDRVYGGLLPGDKVDRLEQLLAEKSEKGTLIFAGDGINDAPVLARADVGIAMGGLGSDAAIEAADVVIMTDEPSKIADAVQIARRTLRIVNQNIVFALAVKLGVLILGAFGMATMWEAVFADVGVSVLAILNALRTLRGSADRG